MEDRHPTKDEMREQMKDKLAKIQRSVAESMNEPFSIRTPRYTLGANDEPYRDRR